MLTTANTTSNKQAKQEEEKKKRGVPLVGTFLFCPVALQLMTIGGAANHFSYCGLWPGFVFVFVLLLLVCVGRTSAELPVHKNK